ALRERVLHVGEQALPHADRDPELLRLDAVVDDVAPPLAAHRIGNLVDQRLARLGAALEVLVAEGDAHAERRGGDVVVALVQALLGEREAHLLGAGRSVVVVELQHRGPRKWTDSVYNSNDKVTSSCCAAAVCGTALARPGAAALLWRGACHTASASLKELS